MGIGIVAEARQTWSSRSCPLGYRPFSGQTGLMTPSSPTEKPSHPPSPLNCRHTFSHTRGVTTGSDQRNSSYFGSFYWFCFSSLIRRSQLDRQSNSVTCSFGGDLFNFQKWNWSQADYIVCQKAYVCTHLCFPLEYLPIGHPRIPFTDLKYFLLFTAFYFEALTSSNKLVNVITMPTKS